MDLAPDQPERWYELGDVYFHDGPYLQIESYPAAGGGRLPPVGGAGLGHCAARVTWSRSRCWTDDTAAVRRLGALYLARDSSGELLGFYRWRIAEGLHDERALAALRAEYRQMRLPSLWRIMNYAVLDGRRAGGRGVGRRRHPRQGGAGLRLAAQQDLPARLRDQPRPSRGGAGRHGAPG